MFPLPFYHCPLYISSASSRLDIDGKSAYFSPGKRREILHTQVDNIHFSSLVVVVAFYADVPSVYSATGLYIDI